MWLAAKFYMSKKLFNTYSVNNIFYQIIKPMCVCHKPDRYIKEKLTLSPNLMPLSQGKEYEWMPPRTPVSRQTCMYALFSFPLKILFLCNLVFHLS